MKNKHLCLIYSEILQSSVFIGHHCGGPGHLAGDHLQQVRCFDSSCFTTIL